ncbi:MAG: TasA family protein [Candidatus Nealsonbacteria bacterium]|nr:TasA family protein [Candidatus Nealsonbacteria bacterium]
MNKKIIISLCVIGAVAAIAVGGTIAYFSDVETSTGNTFTAGTLNLTLDDHDGDNVVKFTVTNANPGQSGVGTWKLVNAGSLAGYVDLESITATDTEELNPESETNKVEPGDLSANMDVVLFWDDGAGTGGVAGDGIQNGTEATIYSGKLSGIATNYNANYSLLASATTYVTMTWSVGTGVGNDIQGDKTVLGITFELGQDTTQ